MGAVLGPERASFARAFGKLGDPEEAAAVHCAAGLSDVVAARVEGIRVAPDAASFWRELAAENGHFRRVAGGLNEDDAEALAAEMEARLEPYRTGDRLVLPRALVLVAARSSCGVSQLPIGHRTTMSIQ